VLKFVPSYEAEARLREPTIGRACELECKRFGRTRQ
jgi:hypothetical protein